MNLSAIKETAFHKDARPDLIRQFETKYADDDSPWVYVAYIESTKSRNVLFYSCCIDEIHPVCSLVEYLEDCGELKTLQQTALALDTFYQSGVLHSNSEALARLALIVRGKYDAWTPYPIADSILMESNGLLIWHDQLERLLACAGIISLTERTQLRKHLNQQRPEAWGRARNLLLPDGHLLERVMDERMLPLHCTCGGNWNGATLLYYRMLEHNNG